MNKRLLFSLLLLSLVFLTACGGSGSDELTAPKIDPILVNAGTDLSLDEGEVAELTGGSSGGKGVLVYRWQANGVAIVHDDTSVPTAQLTAPVVTSETVFSVTLIATDENGNQGSDQFMLRVLPINESPSAVISANQIEGYNALEFPVTASIQLDASSSSDSDPQNVQEAEISRYHWQQISGPSLLAGVQTDLSVLQVTSPLLNTTQTAVIRLSVFDQEDASDTSEITLTLLAESETKPNVTIITPRDAFSGEMLLIKAEPESLSQNAAPFSVQWSSLTGANIENTEQLITTITLPFSEQNAQAELRIDLRDSFNNEANAQVSHGLLTPTLRYINDTGITAFASADGIQSDYSQEFPGQDAALGGDRQVISGAIQRVGDGDSGFDFTALDSNGDAIDSENGNLSNGLECIRDNVTGLVWQALKAQDDADIHSVDQAFTWYFTDENGNEDGDLNTGNDTCNLTSACNTSQYILEVNQTGLCGAFDWRLPSVEELNSIVHYGVENGPMADTQFFKNWGNSDDQTLWFWTRQTSADGVNNDTAKNAWAIDFLSANDGFLPKSSAQRVILVRAGR